MAENNSGEKKNTGKMTNYGLHKPVSPIVELPSSPPMDILSAKLDIISHTRTLVPEDILGDRLRKKREEKRLTQEALSILCRELDPNSKGISRPSIVAYENGETLPGARELRLLADALEVTPSWIILGEYDAPQEVDIENELSRFIHKIAYNVARQAAHDVLREFIEHNQKMDQLDADFDPSAYRTHLERAATEAAKKETQKRNKKSGQKK